MDIFLTIIKCIFLIIGGTIIFAILQGLFVLLLTLPALLSEHFSNKKDNIDEDFEKTYYSKPLEKQKKVETKIVKKETDNELNLRNYIYYKLWHDYNMPTHLCYELSNHYPAYLYSLKRKGSIKEEEYRRRIGRWFGLIQGYFYFSEETSIETGYFEPVDHEDSNYIEGYKNSYKEGMMIFCQQGQG